MKGEQPFCDDEPLRREVLRRAERPVRVAIDGLEHRLVRAQVADVLRQDVEVVAFRIQRRHVPLRALAPVEAVVVVRAEVRDHVGAEDAHQAARDRGLPRAGVADDAEHDRPRHQCRPGIGLMHLRGTVHDERHDLALPSRVVSVDPDEVRRIRAAALAYRLEHELGAWTSKSGNCQSVQ